MAAGWWGSGAAAVLSAAGYGLMIVSPPCAQECGTMHMLTQTACRALWRAHRVCSTGRLLSGSSVTKSSSLCSSLQEMADYTRSADPNHLVTSGGDSKAGICCSGLQLQFTVPAQAYMSELASLLLPPRGFHALLQSKLQPGIETGQQ